MRKISWLLMTMLPSIVHSQSPAVSASKIPIRQLDIVAKSTEPLGSRVVVRELSNGSVMVNDGLRSRVLMFDSTLTHHSMVIDSGGGFSRQFSSQLIRYFGDSTLYVDLSASTLLVIDANGKIARTMALPKSRDATYVASISTSSATVDAKGRLIYSEDAVPVAAAVQRAEAIQTRFIETNSAKAIGCCAASDNSNSNGSAKAYNGLCFRSR